MSGVAKRLVARLLWMSGMSKSASRRALKTERFVIELHGVPERRYPELPSDVRPGVTKEDLESILSWLSQRTRFLTPEELLQGDLSGVLLTFDDGFANNHDVVLPLLEHYRAPAIFFVATGHISAERKWLPFVREQVNAVWPNPDLVPESLAVDLFDGMDESQLSACGSSDLVTVGAHSVTHPHLTRVAAPQVEDEIRASKSCLERLTGRPVNLFAYPFGDANSRVVRAVGEAGFQAAFVETPLKVEQPRLAIPRVGLFSSAEWYLAGKMSGTFDRLLELRG